MSNESFTLPNLRRVTFARCWYQNTNDSNDKRAFAPEEPTHHGVRISTLNEQCRARALAQQDQWVFYVTFSFTGGQALTYRGTRADKLFSAYKGIVYGSKH